jgi:hypothetical protein
MNIKNNVVFGFIEKCLLLILGFINRVVLIRFLGNEYVGLGSLFTAIMQVLNFAELGLESAILFKLYEPVACKDTDTINKFLNFYRTFCFNVGIIISIVAVIIIPFLRYLIKGDIPADVNVYILYVLYAITSIQGYFFWGYQTVLFNAAVLFLSYKTFFKSYCSFVQKIIIYTI